MRHVNASMILCKVFEKFFAPQRIFSEFLFAIELSPLVTYPGYNLLAVTNDKAVDEYSSKEFSVE